jgi:multiple sugar transport system substrate-binding protein
MKRLVVFTLVLLVGLCPTVFASATKEAAKKVTLTYVTWDGPERHIPYYNALRASEAKFEQDHPNITVNYQYIPNEDYLSKIATMMLSGNAPDLVYHDEFWINPYLLDDQVLDLKPFIQKDPDSVKGIYPSIINGMQWKGIQYSLGSAHLPMIMWYRKDLFREAGLARPTKGWTWDQFLEAAKKLTKKNDKGEITQYGFQGGLGEWIFGISAFGYSNGSLPIVAKEKKINLGSPEIIEVFARMADMIYKDKVATRVDVALAGQVGKPYQTGRVAMFYNGSWVQGDPGFDEYEWGATYVPINKGHVPLTSNVVGWFILKQSKNHQEAFELAKAFAAPYAQKLFAEAGFPSVRADINAQYAFKSKNLDDTDRAVLYDIMSNVNYLAGDVWRVPNMNKVIDEYLKMEFLILTDQKKPEDIKQLVPTIQALIQ